MHLDGPGRGCFTLKAQAAPCYVSLLMRPLCSCLSLLSACRCGLCPPSLIVRWADWVLASAARCRQPAQGIWLIAVALCSPDVLLQRRALKQCICDGSCMAPIAPLHLWLNLPAWSCCTGSASPADLLVWNCSMADRSVSSQAWRPESEAVCWTCCPSTVTPNCLNSSVP